MGSDGRVTKETLTSAGVTGSLGSIGASALQLCSQLTVAQLARKYDKGIEVKADPANGGNLFVGWGSGVTAGGTSGTDGYILSAGQSVFIQTEDISRLYVIASTTGQKAYFIAQ